MPEISLARSASETFWCEERMATNHFFLQRHCIILFWCKSPHNHTTHHLQLGRRKYKPCFLNFVIPQNQHLQTQKSAVGNDHNPRQDGKELWSSSITLYLKNAWKKPFQLVNATIISRISSLSLSTVLVQEDSRSHLNTVYYAFLIHTLFLFFLSFGEFIHAFTLGSAC